MSLGNLFSSNYWFGTPLAPTTQALWLMGVIFGGLILFGIYSQQKRKQSDTGIQRGVWRRFATWGWSTGLVGFVYFFARYERMPVFRNRYWFLVWFLFAAIWLYFVLKHAKHKAPALSAKAKEQAFKERYLPKNNKGKR